MPTLRDIEEALKEIGDRLSFDCSFTHFGGCNMTMQGIKDSTKDVDVVFDPAHHFGTLVADLEDLYDWTTYNHVMERYVAPQYKGVLTDWEVLQGPLTIDLFPPGRIFNVLTFSPMLLERRRMRHQMGRLSVYQVDVTTTFMLKAVTGRWRKEPDRDLEDLQDILTKRGNEMDWDFMEAEWKDQMDACPDPAKAQMNAQEAVDHLRREGYHVAWEPGGY